jgi:hypothetical protein
MCCLRRKDANFALAVVLLALAGSHPAAAKPLRIVLSSPLVDVGSGPDGCTPAISGFGGPPVWQVQLERLLLDGKALVEMSREAMPNRLPLCIADRPVAANVDAELSFVAHDGRVARAVGIVLRFADPQDYYIVEADLRRGRVRVLRILNGEYREIAGRAAPLAMDKSQTLGVKVVGERFMVSLNGEVLLETRDGAIAAPGRVGVSSRADSVTSIGDLFITTLD